MTNHTELENEHVFDYKMQEMEEEQLRIAKERLLEDDSFLHDLKRKLTDDSNYFHSAVDSVYSKIEIIRNKNKYIELKWTFRMKPDGIDILWLKRDYPNSEVRIVNYEWKIDYIEIIEKHQIAKTD